jgi:hypothetical protein
MDWNVIWTIVIGILTWTAATLKKMLDAGTPITWKTLLKEILTFN